MARFASARRAARWTVGTGVVGGFATFSYLYTTEPGVRRGVAFWRVTGPILAHYKLEQWRARDDEDKQARYLRLHALYASEARLLIEELRGMLIKVAQVMSVRPEIVPADYRHEFRKLQDMAPPARWEPIREVLERDLGAPLEQIFERIEQVPLGAASVGQAHLAEYRGRPVVVKVQYPDAYSMFHADFRCLEALLWCIDEDALTILRQVRTQFEVELDYAQEARHLQLLHDALAAAPEFAGRVCVPELVPELTGGNVIGMSYLPGPKLEVVLRERLAALGIHLRDGESPSEWIAARQRSGLEDGSSVTTGLEGTRREPEEHPALAPGAPAPRWWMRAGHAAIRLLGIDFSLRLFRAVTEMRWISILRGKAIPASTAQAASASELRDIMRLVLDVHGYQLFFCDIFNGDPHPGNILLLPDGRLGLIDFGQCRRLTHTQKVELAHLMLALTEPRSPDADLKVAAAFAATGVASRKSDERYLSLLPRLMFCSLKSEYFEPGYLKEALAGDRIEAIPVHVVMAYRAAMLLRGLHLVLQENVSVADAWRPWAERWLRENHL